MNLIFQMSLTHWWSWNCCALTDKAPILIPLSLLEWQQKRVWTLNTFGVSTDFTKTVGKKQIFQCSSWLFPWTNIAKEEKKQQNSINSCNRLWWPLNFANWIGKVVLEGEWTWAMSNFLTSSCTIYTDKNKHVQWTLSSVWYVCDTC